MKKIFKFIRHKRDKNLNRLTYPMHSSMFNLFLLNMPNKSRKLCKLLIKHITNKINSDNKLKTDNELKVVLDDGSFWARLCSSRQIQVVAPAEVGRLFDSLADYISQGQTLHRPEWRDAETVGNLSGLLFREEGAEERDFFHEWRDFLYEQGFMSNRSNA